MKVGTKSLLFGVHCFFIHPIFVFLAWKRLYGFPFDPRLWVAFIVHDWGYWGKPNMDGPEGEEHVVLGAKIMHFLFDWKIKSIFFPLKDKDYERKWHDFCLYHSRFYAKRDNSLISRLCIADKLAFSIQPSWMYIPMATWSGEIYEYMGRAAKYDSERPIYEDKKQWHHHVHRYMLRFIAGHKEGGVDTMTGIVREPVNQHGVY